MEERKEIRKKWKEEKEGDGLRFEERMWRSVEREGEEIYRRSKIRKKIEILEKECK